MSSGVLKLLVKEGTRLACSQPRCGRVILPRRCALFSLQARKKLLERVPMNRLGQPEDVAQAVSFLVAAEAGYITGITLNVNGGMYM